VISAGYFPSIPVEGGLWGRIKEMTGRVRIVADENTENNTGPLRRPIYLSALAVPSYHRILVKHGLIEKTLSIPDAYRVFLQVGADPEVQKLSRKAERGRKMKHVPALYLATGHGLQGMSKQSLKL